MESLDNIVKAGQHRRLTIANSLDVNPLEKAVISDEGYLLDNGTNELEKAARSAGLVKKVITNKKGHKQTVWVNPSQDQGGKEKPKEGAKKKLEMPTKPEGKEGDLEYHKKMVDYHTQGRDYAHQEGSGMGAMHHRKQKEAHEAKVKELTNDHVPEVYRNKQPNDGWKKITQDDVKNYGGYEGLALEAIMNAQTKASQHAMYANIKSIFEQSGRSKVAFLAKIRSMLHDDYEMLGQNASELGTEEEYVEEYMKMISDGLKYEIPKGEKKGEGEKKNKGNGKLEKPIKPEGKEGDLEYHKKLVEYHKQGLAHAHQEGSGMGAQHHHKQMKLNEAKVKKFSEAESIVDSIYEEIQRYEEFDEDGFDAKEDSPKFSSIMESVGMKVDRNYLDGRDFPYGLVQAVKDGVYSNEQLSNLNKKLKQFVSQKTK